MIANGMYGAFIVDPVHVTPAQEFVFVQSEFYTTREEGKKTLDWAALLHGAPAYVVFNGRAGQYADAPLRVTAGQPVRVYVVNAGPNHASAFHIVGTIFDRVYPDGHPDHALRGVQTWDVPPGGGAIFEVTMREPGTYPIVTHSFADASKGALGAFQVVAPGSEVSRNPARSQSRKRQDFGRHHSYRNELNNAIGRAVT
jgi:nitrite reductase (NO-forming)